MRSYGEVVAAVPHKAASVAHNAPAGSSASSRRVALCRLRVAALAVHTTAGGSTRSPRWD